VHKSYYHIYKKCYKIFGRKGMKKRYLLYILPVVLIVIMIVTGYRDSVKTNLSETFAPISLKHYYGTDHLGRDIFSLIVDGAVRTLATVFIASAISVSFGLVLGMLGGYFGKSLEIVIVFFTDKFKSNDIQEEMY